MSSAFANESSIDATAVLVSFATTPLLTKQGIDRARNYARTKLRNTENTDSRNTASQTDGNQNLLGLKFGEDAKRKPATPKPEPKSAYGGLKFGNVAKRISPQPEWQTSRASESNKTSREDNLKTQTPESPKESSLTHENQAIQKEGVAKKAPGKIRTSQKTYKPESNDLDKLELALKRYSDMYEKGLIEKDEYDALRKREMGLQ